MSDLVAQFPIVPLLFPLPAKMQNFRLISPRTVPSLAFCAGRIQQNGSADLHQMASKLGYLQPLRRRLDGGRTGEISEEASTGSL